MKKIFFYTCFFLIILVVEIFNWLGFLCDEIFFWNYKKLTVKTPVFIVGMPRSATTFLFNTLSEDKERFTAMKLWEIIFAPSVTQKKVVVILSKIDRRLKGLLFNPIRKFEKKLLLQFESIHHVSLTNVEEDEYILIHFLSCALLVFIFPKWKHIHSLIRFDSDLSENRKKRILKFYKKCIQKHKYVFGSDKIYLSKSPSHTSKIHSLRIMFPGCRFIYMLRIPEETISSAIGMYKVYNRIFYSNAGLQLLASQTMDFADIWYSYLEQLENSAEGNAIILKFDDLVKNPAESVKSIYKTFDYQMNDSFKNRLKIINDKSAFYSSRHRHSLEENGLEQSYVRERYSQVYEKYY